MHFRETFYHRCFIVFWIWPGAIVIWNKMGFFISNQILLVSPIVACLDIGKGNTSWKVSVFWIILVRIFLIQTTGESTANWFPKPVSCNTLVHIDFNFMLISEKHFIWKITKTTNKNENNNLMNNYNFVAMLLIAKYFFTSFFIYIFYGFFHLFDLLIACLWYIGGYPSNRVFRWRKIQQGHWEIFIIGRYALVIYYLIIYKKHWYIGSRCFG